MNNKNSLSMYSGMFSILNDISLNKIGDEIIQDEEETSILDNNKFILIDDIETKIKLGFAFEYNLYNIFLIYFTKIGKIDISEWTEQHVYEDDPDFMSSALWMYYSGNANDQYCILYQIFNRIFNNKIYHDKYYIILNGTKMEIAWSRKLVEPKQNRPDFDLDCTITILNGIDKNKSFSYILPTSLIDTYVYVPTR